MNKNHKGIKKLKKIIFPILLFVTTFAKTQPQAGVHWSNAIKGTPISTMISVKNQLQPLNNGVKWIRTVIPWHEIDTAAGAPYNWMQLEKNIDSLKQWGFEIIATIRGTPDWYTTNPTPTVTPQYNNLYAPQDTIEWVRFLDSLVSKFGSKINYWEIWNEPDGPFLLTAPPNNNLTGKKDAYIRLLKSAYHKIKSFNDTNDSILLGGLTSRVILDKKIFFDGLFTDSAFKYFDIMNFHLYEAAYSFRDTLLAKMQTYGIANKPIWITETNPWRELAANGGNSLTNTLNYLCTWINDTIINYFNPNVICWFNMRNWVTSLGIVCDNCNPNQTAYGLFDSLYNPTPLLPAFTSCINTVSNVSNENIKDNWVATFSPNPFSIETTFHTEHLLKNATLIVCNYFGQIVKQIKNISGESITLTRDNLPNGLYFVQLIEENRIVAVSKLVIND